MHKYSSALPILLIVLLTGILSIGVNAEEASLNLEAAASRLAFDRLAENSIHVKALDSPANPYAGEYSAIDQWIYDNTVNDRATFYGQSMDDDAAAAYVTAEGYMVPVYLQMRELEILKKSGRHPDGSQEPPYQVYAVGKMDPELRQAWRDKSQMIKAQYTPQIPQWLAVSPPPNAMFTDSGAVVTAGLPGELVKRKSSPDDFPSSPLPFYLYSPTGEQLAGPSNTINGLFGVQRWQDIYEEMSRRGWTSTDTGLGFKGSVVENRSAGVYQFRNAAGEIIGIFNYDGTELTEQTAPVRDAHLFSFVNAHMLPEIYEAQQRLAATD